MRKGKKSLYDILGIGKEATGEEIRRAYKGCAQRLHPDKETGDEDAFKEALAAYEVLMDATRRKYYDEHGEIPTERQDAFISEAIAVILYLVDSVPDVRSGDLVAQAKTLVTRAKNKAEESLQEINAKIDRRKEAASRLSCADGEENILASALLADIKTQESALKHVEGMRDEAVRMLEFLSRYSYRKENTTPNRASTFFVAGVGDLGYPDFFRRA